MLGCVFMIRVCAVGSATGYGLDDGGVEVRVPAGSRIFSFPRRPDRFGEPPADADLLSDTQGYR
jgi:hypothetical protein